MVYNTCLTQSSVFVLSAGVSTAVQTTHISWVWCTSDLAVRVHVLRFTRQTSIQRACLCMLGQVSDVAVPDTLTPSFDTQRRCRHCIMHQRVIGQRLVRGNLHRHAFCVFAVLAQTALSEPHDAWGCGTLTEAAAGAAAGNGSMGPEKWRHLD